MSKAAEIDIVSVSKIYGATTAVEDISLKIPAGTYCCLLGPSGCGKTTLLRLIAGFEPPDRGRIVLDGEVLANGGAAVPAYRRGIGVVAQDGALFPHLTIASNI
ncbi:MAG: ATP-binding cassette domain-containing protein, partial [Mesorhizobium sp.]